MRKGFALGRGGPAPTESKVDPNLDEFSDDDIPPLEDIEDIPDLVADSEVNGGEQDSVDGENPGQCNSGMQKSWAERVEDEEKVVDPKSLLPVIVPPRTVSFDSFCLITMYML